MDRAQDVSELSISDMLEALASGALTSVDLVCAYLNRIAFYDRTGIRLNSVPVLNPGALAEAEASDRRRGLGAAGALEGIPFTVKDSYKVRGLTVASGSPAFEDLVADSDAASVELLRAAGAVLIGKTNMPPMAAAGVHPGAYGYAKSPYHPGYLTAAYGSGSSSGAGTATAASFGAFGMAEETLSSGRSPASNNGLSAYTPSRGMISIRGNWPLTPTCDVVVPYARSMDDLLRLVDVLVADDPDATGDFWRSQRVVELPRAAEIRPASFLERGREDLTGLRFGVPRMFIGEDAEKRNPVALRPSVRALWDRAAADLARLGAEIVPVDFPVVSNYEMDRPGAQGLVERGLLHERWNDTEKEVLLVGEWEEFLRVNGMPGLSSLGEVDGTRIFPNAPDSVYAKAGVAYDFPRFVEIAKEGTPSWSETPGFEQSLRGLEQARRDDFERWLAELGLDAVVFPTNGDVASEGVFDRPEELEAALRNGVVFSNGNRVIRHLGIPTVTVPMGRMADISMPVGMTIAGPAYSDRLLLEIADVYESGTQRRPAPPRAPWLPSSELRRLASADSVGSARDERRPLDFEFDAEALPAAEGWRVRATARVADGERWLPDDLALQAWVDGRTMQVMQHEPGVWSATARLSSELERLDDCAILVMKLSGPEARTAAGWQQVPLPT